MLLGTSSDGYVRRPWCLKLINCISWTACIVFLCLFLANAIVYLTTSRAVRDTEPCWPITRFIIAYAAACLVFIVLIAVGNCAAHYGCVGCCKHCNLILYLVIFVLVVATCVASVFAAFWLADDEQGAACEAQSDDLFKMAFADVVLNLCTLGVTLLLVVAVFVHDCCLR
jgi:hypothetical protein